MSLTSCRCNRYCSSAAKQSFNTPPVLPTIFTCTLSFNSLPWLVGLLLKFLIFSHNGVVWSLALWMRSLEKLGQNPHFRHISPAWLLPRRFRPPPSWILLSWQSVSRSWSRFVVTEDTKLPRIWTGLLTASYKYQPSSHSKYGQFAVLIPQASQCSVNVASRPRLLTRAYQYDRCWVGQVPVSCESTQARRTNWNHPRKVTHSLSFCPQRSSLTHHEKPVTFPAYESTGGLPDLSKCAKDIFTALQAQIFVTLRNSLLAESRNSAVFPAGHHSCSSLASHPSLFLLTLVYLSSSLASKKEYKKEIFKTWF